MAYGGGEMYYGIPEPDTAALMTMLEKVVPADSSVPYEHKLVIGDPADAIVDLAKEEKVDLVVMGTHGRTGFSRLLMGSVAEAVVRRSPCPVFVFKSHEGSEAKKGRTYMCSGAALLLRGNLP